MTALHVVQANLQPTTVIAQRLLHRMLREQSASQTNGDAACVSVVAVTEARERQEGARRICDQKCGEAAEAETNFHDATLDVFVKAEALERHVKTVTVRVELLATAEVDFFKTLLKRHEELKTILDVLTAQSTSQCLWRCSDRSKRCPTHGT